VQSSDLAVRRHDIQTADAQELIQSLNEELNDLYPEEGANHFRLDPSEMEPGRGAFLVVTCAGESVACGAIRRIDRETGELKRMYVRPKMRRRGIARALLKELEAEARSLGISRIVLETGTMQPGAIGLYKREGFIEIPPFGEYVGSPFSVCMEKKL